MEAATAEPEDTAAEESAEGAAAEGAAAEDEGSERDAGEPEARVTGAGLTVERRMGGGRTVTVPAASIEGWLVTRRDDDGEPVVPESIGRTYIEESEQVQITFDEPLQRSQHLWIMLHKDSPEDEDWSFPRGDPPVTGDGGIVAEHPPYYINEDAANEDDAE